MNYRYVVNQLGKLLVVFSAIMGAVPLVAWALNAIEGYETDPQAAAALGISSATCLVTGLAVWLLTRKGSMFLGRREAMVLVTMTWVLGAVFAALPYFIWAHIHGDDAISHRFQTFDNCYFEATSGLTTTGATILEDIEAVPRELLLWRAMTHWVGGLGIVVLFVAVLPSLGAGGKKLFHVEATGPTSEGLQPQIRQTARILWVIYLSLTVLLVIALWLLGGMRVFDAICHAFSTVATGGFSTKNASIGYYYNKPMVDTLCVLFMVICAANFGLFYQLWRRNTAVVWKDTEFRLYLVMLLLGVLIVMGSIAVSDRPVILTTGDPVESNFTQAFREGVVATTSIHTTTGFCTSDFNQWPFLAKAVIMAMMFVGGSSGSTAGGIKVIRIWIALRTMIAEIERFFRPDVVRPVRVSGAIVDRQLQLNTMVYIACVVMLFVVGWVSIMLIEQANHHTECSLATAATAAISTLCTIGPGFDAVGPVENYGWFSAPSKLLMCLLMTLGRLEIFAVLVLVRPGFWKAR